MACDLHLGFETKHAGSGILKSGVHLRLCARLPLCEPHSGDLSERREPHSGAQQSSKNPIMVPKKEMEEKDDLYDECGNYPQDEERKKIDDTRREDPAQHIKMDRLVYPESAELDSRRLDTSLNPASGLELVLIPRASDYLVAAGAAQRCHSVGASPLRSVPVYLSGATSDPGVLQERRGGSPPLDINTGSENPERIEGFALCDGATFSVEDTPTPVYSVRKSTPTLTCTYCGLSGHDARRCWDNPQSTKCRRKYEQRGSPTPCLPPGTSPSEHRSAMAYQRTCFECGQSNHLRKQCDRLDTNLRAPNAGSAIRNPGSEPAPIALRAYSRTTSREGLSTTASNGSSVNRTSCRLTAVLGLTTRVGFHSRPRPPYQGHDKESLCSEGNLDMGHQYTHARAHADTPPTSSIHDMEMPMDSPKLRPTLVVHETPLLAAAVDGHRLERETRSPFPPPLLNHHHPSIVLFQILSCILGLFAAYQQRLVLIAVFSISALVSTAYSVGLIAWYANLVSGWDRTQPLLSAGLPFGYSFFLRHTPFCSSRFNLLLSKWEQDAGCIVPYHAVEVLQASLHAILSLIAFILSIFALLEIRREAKDGKSSTPHTTSTVDKVQPSCGSALAEATRLATAEAPNGLHRGGARNHLRLKGANGTATITAPDSLNDLSSGYMNSSYESAADRDLALNYTAHGNNDNNNIDQRRRKYAPLKENGKQNRQKMTQKREALVHQCQESKSKSVPIEMPSAVGKISPQEESYSSAATVEMNGSVRAKTNSSSPPVVNPPLSNPPPPPLPFLEELKKSHPYTAIVHKQRPLSRHREPLTSPGYAPVHNQRSIPGGGGSTRRIYAKNTTTNANGGGSGGYSALGRSHQLRSSLSRLKQHVEEVVDESLSSEYLFPKKLAAERGGQLRCRHLPLGGIEGIVERMSAEKHDSSSLGDYLVSKGSANLTQLISFDPKSTIPLKVQGHRNSSAESSDDENDANQSPLKKRFTSGHKGTEEAVGSSRPKGHPIGDSDEESLPSTKAPILQSGLYRPSPSFSLTENNMSPTTVGRHTPSSALLRRRMPYEESELRKSQLFSPHDEPCNSEFGVGLVRSPTAPAESSSHVAKLSDWELAGIPHLRPVSASGFQKSTSGGSDGRPNTSYYCAGGSALERLQSGARFQPQSSGPTTAFPSRPKSLLEAFNHSIYECVENRPLASTAFPVRQDEPEHLVAGVSVASAVSLSKANTTSAVDELRQSNPYVNCPPSTFASPYSFTRQRPPPTNFPIAQAPLLYGNDEGLLV